MMLNKLNTEMKRRSRTREEIDEMIQREDVENNRGFMKVNTRRRDEGDPDYWGQIIVDGIKYQLGAWGQDEKFSISIRRWLDKERG